MLCCAVSCTSRGRTAVSRRHNSRSSTVFKNRTRTAHQNLQTDCTRRRWISSASFSHEPPRLANKIHPPNAVHARRHRRTLAFPFTILSSLQRNGRRSVRAGRAQRRPSAARIHVVGHALARRLCGGEGLHGSGPGRAEASGIDALCLCSVRAQSRAGGYGFVARVVFVLFLVQVQQ